MDFRNSASSNFSSNITSESGSTDFVEDLVRLETEAAGDDFLLDLGGAAEVLSERPATATLAARMANLDSAALVLAQHVRFTGMDNLRA
jgi:hypothetical protein